MITQLKMEQEKEIIYILMTYEGHFKAYKNLSNEIKHEIYNLGTGESISVLNLVKVFEKINNLKIAYRISNRRKGDLARCFADSSKANCKLNWEAVYTLENMCKDAWTVLKK